MKLKRLRQESWMRPPLDEPEYARQEDLLRCRLLFERHGRTSNLDLYRGKSYAAYSNAETRAAWHAWCAALNLAGSHLDPNLSDIDWWTRCANKPSPSFEYVPPGGISSFPSYVQLGDGPIWIDRDQAWMLPLRYRAMIERTETNIAEQEDIDPAELNGDNVGMAAYIAAAMFGP